MALLSSVQDAGAGDTQWSVARADVVRQINSDLKPGVPTADVAIYYPSNLDEAFAKKVPLDGALLEQFVRAKEIFAVAGVQLNLLWVKTGVVDPAFFEIQSNDMTGKTPGGAHVNMYRDNLREGSSLSAEARQAFETIVEPHEDNDRTIYLVVLQNVFMSFFERVDERTWQLRTIGTGGLSFPSYSYTDIPRRLRGVITIDKDDPLKRIVAHELGHKLMNVSHEYREIDPQHEVRAEGGLMLYGSGTEIAAGKEGRWHRERLHLSPYVYRQSADGRKTRNPDYREGGHYYDPVYGDKVIEFGPTPAP
ncbi:MAG: hypothetical protein AB7T20_09530 [Steroidobacteraceae bacterium]